MKKKLTVLLAALLVVTALAGCNTTAPQPSSSDSANPGSSSETPANNAFKTTLEDIKTKGELVVGLDDTFAPMGFRDEAGTLVGLDIDLARAVGEKLGVTVRFQPIDWNTKEMELGSGNIDCIWNGMSVNEERKTTMSLSKAYLNNRIIIMTAEGVVIETKEDLLKYNVATQSGSSALDTLMADPLYPQLKDKLTEFPTYDEALLDMKAGRTDCIVIDEVLGNYKNSMMNSPYGVSAVDFGDEFYAIGFRKSDTELTQTVNDAIKSLIDDGTAAEIGTKWFGKDVIIFE